jgi:insulysin
VFDSVEDRESQYLDKPAVYLSHLLGHEGPESLLSYLKKQGLVNGLGASIDAELSDFYTFQVSASLTMKGLDNIDVIVEAIYSYINMLKENPTPRYVYEEVLQLR